MEIPAFYASFEEGKMLVSDGTFSSIMPRKGSRAQDFTETVSGCLPIENKPPVTIIDCNSFEVREFSEKVMKHLKLRNTEIWFFTYIETVEDVFDSFNKDASLVFAPYHFIKNDAELKDICSVSDSVVPVIFIHKGQAVLPGGKKTDVIKVLDKLVSIGYYRNCVLDMGRSLDDYTWSIIREDYPSTIPFVDSEDQVKGFQTQIIPYLL
jgi:hypothetical protein